MANRDASSQLIIITNTILPYSIHNVSYLALPSGLTYHFRYRLKNFQPPIGIERDQWILSLKGIEGLLVLRDWDRATFIPLRMIKIHAIESLGEFVSIELEFLNFVQYDSIFVDTEKNKNVLSPDIIALRLSEREKYNTKILQTIPKIVKNEPKQNLEPLIIGYDKSLTNIVSFDNESDPRTTLLHWYNIIVLLGELACFKGLSFYRIVSIVESAHPTTNLKPMVINDDFKGYCLYCGNNYLLKLLQAIPSSEKSANLPFTMQIEVSENQIKPVRSAELVDSHYDEITFQMFVQPQTNTQIRSSIIIQSNQKIKYPQEIIADSVVSYKDGILQIPGNVIPVSIRWTRWAIFLRKIAPLLLAALAILLWFCAPWLNENTFLGNWGLTAEYIRYIAIFILAFSLKDWSVFTGQFKI